MKLLIWFPITFGGWILFFWSQVHSPREVPASAARISAPPAQPAVPSAAPAACDRRPIPVPTNEVTEALAHVRRETARRQPERALALVTKALQASPDDPRLLAEAGRIQLLLGENEQAASHLERAIALDPDQPDALGQLVAAYDNPRLAERGRRALHDLAHSRHPDHAGLALAYSDLLSRQGMPGVAADYLESRAAGLRSPGDVLFTAASLRQQMGDPERAQALYRAAAASEERQLSSPADGQSRALAQSNLQRDQDALNALDRAHPPSEK